MQPICSATGVLLLSCHQARLLFCVSSHPSLRVIQCPANVFKDLFQIIHLEMDPAQAAKNNYKWTPRLCMAVPPSAPNIIPLCQPGLVRLKDKMLIFLQLTRANVQLPPGHEPLSFCIPLVYDFGNNSTSLPQVTNLLSYMPHPFNT